MSALLEFYNLKFFSTYSSGKHLLLKLFLCHCMSGATPTPNPTPTPMPPPLVQGVTVSRTVQGSSPAFRVSWSAVSGNDITYTVCYAEVNTNPRSWECVEGITGTSTTLGRLSPGTTYQIWVRAASSVGPGHSSYGRLHRTYQGEQSQTCIVHNDQ